MGEEKKTKTKTNYVGQREYARMRDVHLKTVQDAIKSGRLKKCLVEVPHGKKTTNKIIPDIADKEWAENTYHENRPKKHEGNKLANDYDKSPSKEPTKNQKDQIRKLANTSLNSIAELMEFSGEPPDMARSRSFHEFFKAKLLELDFKEKERELIPADEVTQEWENLLASFKSKLRGIPTKLAPTLAIQKDPVKIQTILLETIDDCLKELSRLADEED